MSLLQKTCVVAVATMMLGLLKGSSPIRSPNLSEVINGNNGVYIVNGDIATNDKSSYVSDSTGSINAFGCNRCQGYGQITLSKSGAVYSVNQFKKIEKVETKSVSEINDTLFGLYATTSDGKSVKINKINNPQGQTLVKTSNGWELN